MTDSAEVVLGMWRALSDRDWEALERFLAEDCIYVDMPIGPAAAARGPEDIVKHSGIAEPIPVAKGRVRKRIYESIAAQDADQFFVFKLQSQKELWFCYRTADSRAKFFGSPLGCNMAAVLQWETGAWTFVDLPFVTSASGLIIQTGGTWEEDTDRKSVV